MKDSINPFTTVEPILPWVPEDIIFSSILIACVASVSVCFRNKEIPRKGTFGIDRARKETRAKKWKRGRGKVSFLSSPPVPRSFTCATSLAVLTLVPHSFLLKRTETLATQATILMVRVRFVQMYSRVESSRICFWPPAATILLLVLEPLHLAL